MTSIEELGDLAVTLTANALTDFTRRAGAGEEPGPPPSSYEMAEHARDLLNHADRATQSWAAENGRPAPWTVQEIAYQAARLLVMPAGGLSGATMRSAVDAAMAVYLAAGRVLERRDGEEHRGSRRA